MQPELPEWKAIRSMTDENLKSFLDNNDKIDPHLLAKVCSEILRRNSIKQDNFERIFKEARGNDLLQRG